MSTDRDRKNRREKCLHRSRGNDKKRTKSFDKAMKRRINKDTEENGGIPPFSIHALFDECPCERCKQERKKEVV